MQSSEELFMSTSADYSGLFSALIEFQSSLSNISLAVATGSGVLLFANRKKKRCLPVGLSIAAGVLASVTMIAGLDFLKTVMANILTLNIQDPYYTINTSIQIILIIVSVMLLAAAGFFTETE